MAQAINRIISSNSLIEQRFFIAECKFGYGLFASSVIKKGQRILNFTGGLIDFEKAVDKEDKYKGDPLQVGKNIYINLEAPGRFVNHSCEPNAGIINDSILVALQDIQVGEEIYFDYSTTMDEDYWTMQCGCGSKHCRKTIQDFKHLSLEVKRRYLELNVVQQFIAIQYQEMLTNM